MLGALVARFYQCHVIIKVIDVHHTNLEETNKQTYYQYDYTIRQITLYVSMYLFPDISAPIIVHGFYLITNDRERRELISHVIMSGCRIYGHRRCLAKNNRLICEGIQDRRTALRDGKPTGTLTSADASTQTPPPWPIARVQRCLTNGTCRIHLLSAGRTMVDGSVRILLVGIDFQVPKSTHINKMSG